MAELLESEHYRDGKVYKIHKATPDGRIELKGLPNETFQLEAGMFFHGLIEGALNFYRDSKILYTGIIQQIAVGTAILNDVVGALSFFRLGRKI